MKFESNANQLKTFSKKITPKEIEVCASIGARCSSSKGEFVRVTLNDVVGFASNPEAIPGFNQFRKDWLIDLQRSSELRAEALFRLDNSKQLIDDEAKLAIEKARKDLNRLKENAIGLAFQCSARFDDDQLDKVSIDDDRLLLLDVDIDSKDATPEQISRVEISFAENDHIIAYWRSRRGEGWHGLFVTRCGEAHLINAKQYILSTWPFADENALKRKHLFFVFPGFLKDEGATIYEATQDQIEALKRAKTTPIKPAPFSPADTTTNQKKAYFDHYLEGLRSECVAISHDDMLKIATRCGCILRECDCVERLNECAKIILEGCSGKEHKSPETIRSVTNQIRFGIDNGQQTIDWKKEELTTNKPVSLSPANTKTQSELTPANIREALWKPVTVRNAIEAKQAEQAFIKRFYDVFLSYDDGLCERSTGYLYCGTDFKRMMKRTVLLIEAEQQAKDRNGEASKKSKSKIAISETVEQILLKDTNDRRRVEIHEVRNYKTGEAVQIDNAILEKGERVPVATINYLPQIAPHNASFTNDDKEKLALALEQFAGCFDTPKEFIWSLNCICHKAAFDDMTRRSKCILFLFDDGLNGAGAGRGKTLFATLPRFLYGRDHVSTTKKKYGFRAEKDFDGDENLMLFNLCNEFRPVNSKGYMDELCAFVDQSKFDYTEKGKKTIAADTVCQLILTANTASEMELTNRTRRRFAFIQFGKDWREGTPGADVIYKMCGNHGDQWEHDDDADAVRLRSCFWKFCEASMREGGVLYAPVLSDVDKMLGHTAGQDLAKMQKAADNTLFQLIIDYLTDAKERNDEAIRNGNAYSKPTLIKTDARSIAERLKSSSQAVQKAIQDNNNGIINKIQTRRGYVYEINTQITDQVSASPASPAETTTGWNYPKTWNEIATAIQMTLKTI